MEDKFDAWRNLEYGAQAEYQGAMETACLHVAFFAGADARQADIDEIMAVLKDIYRITCMTSKASHKEQTDIFQRMRRIIGAGS